MKDQGTPRSVPAALVIAVAVAADHWLAEPPARSHPTVWMGRLLDLLAVIAPPRPAHSALLGGAVGWLAGLVVTIGAARRIQHVLLLGPPGIAAVARGLTLWPLLSLRMLTREVAQVEQALPDLPAGRAAVARIVSRDVTELDSSEVRQAAIETLAENLSDAFIAPLLWYVVADLPGAAAYRFINTADAMWGYRDDRWQHAGMVAARADDVANLLPARVSAWLLCAVPGKIQSSGIKGGVTHLWGLTRRDARLTPSPNAGWPMAAMAHQLDIRLDKRRNDQDAGWLYVLNPQGRIPAGADVVNAISHARTCGYIAAIAAAFVVAFRHHLGMVRAATRRVPLCRR